MSTDQINGMKDDIPEWEEIDVMVDSGAGVSVINTDQAAAAHLGEGATPGTTNSLMGVSTRARDTSVS